MKEACRSACGACLTEARSTDVSGSDDPLAGCGFSGWSICEHSPDFPASLRHLGDPPKVLFGLGRRDRLRLLALDRPTVTIVGARRATAAGRETAESIAAELSAAGVTVISGLARGIDSAAHSGALSAGGTSVAVLGSGPDVCYPKSSFRIYRDTIETGLVVSELAPGSEPRPWTFPARNRLMAAFGKLTVVVEGRRSSGSLITASMAADLGREVGAVPGPVLSACSEGSNALLRDGAQVIRSADDILDSIFGPGSDRPMSRGELTSLEKDLRLLLEAVESSGSSVDQIASRFPGSAVEAGLAKLELLGLVTRDDSGGFRRSARPVDGPV